MIHQTRLICHLPAVKALQFRRKRLTLGWVHGIILECVRFIAAFPCRGATLFSSRCVLNQQNRALVVRWLPLGYKAFGKHRSKTGSPR